MADEQEPLEPEVEGEGEGEGSKPPKATTGGVMRKKLEDTLTENSTLKGQLLIHESGLGHLNEKQRRAVVREAQEGGVELTADLLKETAKDLGYDKPAEPKNEGGEGGPVNEGGSTHSTEEEVEPLNNIDAIDRATRKATSPVDTGSFEAKIKAAKSAEEVEAIIRTEGHKVGIVHQWDVD